MIFLTSVHTDPFILDPLSITHSETCIAYTTSPNPSPHHKAFTLSTSMYFTRVHQKPTRYIPPSLTTVPPFMTWVNAAFTIFGLSVFFTALHRSLKHGSLRISPPTPLHFHVLHKCYTNVTGLMHQSLLSLRIFLAQPRKHEALTLNLTLPWTYSPVLH